MLRGPRKKIREHSCSSLLSFVHEAYALREIMALIPPSEREGERKKLFILRNEEMCVLTTKHSCPRQSSYFEKNL